MTVERVIATFEKTLSDIIIIKTNWLIWKGLRNNLHKGAEYEELLEYSPCFWTITLDNLLSKVLMGTAKLYDEDKGCMGLQKIINICEQHQKLFPKSRTIMVTDGYTGEKDSYIVEKDIIADIKNARQKYQSIKDIRMQLITLRDKHLAHTDKSVFLGTEEFYREISLKGEALEKLIEIAADIVNTFLSNLSDTLFYTEFENADDYEKLLRYVKKGKEAYRQEIRSKINHSN